MTDSDSNNAERPDETPRVAFVTGGTRGIGLACATKLADNGCLVAVGSRTKPDDLDERLLWVECDVTAPESVDSAFTAIEAELGPVTVLVANAGITHDMLFLRMSEEDFMEVVNANLTGSFRVAKRAVRAMMKARWGRIIFMSSIVGANGKAGQANYAASKAGLNGLARSLAREFASRNITVNLIAPGPIETEMFEAVDDAMKEAIIGTVPMKKPGQVDDVAAAVSFLASEDAGYITGATIPVDGGLCMGT